MKLVRTRIGRGGQPTLGTLTSRDGKFSCVTLERSVDGDHPAIPVGTYEVVKATHHPGTPGAYPCPELVNVPGRSCIQMHIANRVDELLGCIAVGEHIDGDAIDESKHAFDRMMVYLDGAFPFHLEITEQA